MLQSKRNQMCYNLKGIRKVTLYLNTISKESDGLQSKRNQFGYNLKESDGLQSKKKQMSYNLKGIRTGTSWVTI